MLLLLDRFEPLKLEYKKDIGDSAAECRFHYPYLSITVIYGDALLGYFANRDFDRLTKILTHEMCHPVTDPLYDKAMTRFANRNEVSTERERLTDHIANILLKNGLV